MAKKRDSLKRVQEDDSRGPSRVDREKVIGSVGVPETPTGFQHRMAETTAYWLDAVTQLRGESFPDIESAIDRIVEIVVEKMKSLDGGSEMKAFMKESLWDSPEVVEVLVETLDIKET
ncbi:hypothetical protein MRY87_06160 [bacterium]|nr:hypothetical protein [bacterium]